MLLTSYEESMPKEVRALLEKQMNSLSLTAEALPHDFQKWTAFLKLIEKTYHDVDQKILTLQQELQSNQDRLEKTVSEHMSFEHKLEKEVTYDLLTGLPNRTLLFDRLSHAISMAERRKTSFGLFFFDLDRFKLINDSLTHKVGDDLLSAVAKRIRSAFRLEDTIARLGGDEFVMVVLDIEEEQSLTNVAMKLLSLFKKPFKVSGRDIFITASVGISIYPYNGKTIDKLLSYADIAMYRAKELGANQFQFYTTKLNHRIFGRLRREKELHQAIERGEFFLYYQPLFDLKTQRITGVEALLRWNHPHKGILSPCDFIPLAEATGFIIPIGEWVLKQAVQQTKKWVDAGLSHIRVSVNVADYQFKQANFVMVVKTILEESELNPHNLELEITENVVVSTPGILTVIKDLKKIGVHISLDDFGTGNSSLNYLKKINANYLKIDRDFVKNIGLIKSDEVIIQAIIDIAHSLNYKVLAEGVETQAQLDFLKSKNCGGIQGYLLGKPMSAKGFEQFFQDFHPSYL